MVVIKAELATERQKISLYDNTQQPLRVLGPGQRHDFILKHDVKVGAFSQGHHEDAAAEASTKRHNV